MNTRNSKYFAGDIIKCARINHNFTQIELAKNLNWSQGYVSKIESGKLIPDAFEWMALSELFNFPADSLRSGYIDNFSDLTINSSLKESGFSIPKKYRDNRCISLRFSMPFLNSVESIAPRAYLKENKIDPSFQSNLSHTVNLSFLEQILSDNNNEEFLKNSSHSFSDLTSHGSLWQQYNNSASSQNALKKLAKNMKKYQVAWDFSVSSEASGTTQLVITPSKLIDDVRIQAPDSLINKFMDKYWLKSLNEFVKIGNLSANESYVLEPIQSYTMGDKSWRFNVSAA